MKKKLFRGILSVIVLLLAVLVAYVLYLLLTYHRIADHEPLDVTAGTSAEAAASTGTDYTITTYNVGFGAYLPDFTFFMDGGKESRAESVESVHYSIEGAADLIAAQNPDFAIFEEVDLDSTRSHHIDQSALIASRFPTFDSTFAINYDSAYLFYPFTCPIGKSKSGIGFYSRFGITSSVRRSLPISTNLSKFIDLDRCYSVNRINVDNGKELVIYAVHLSAYTSDPAVRDGQLEMLFSDMEAEYEKGNYVICGGDLNHDLKAVTDDGIAFDWAHYIDRSSLPEGFSVALDLLSDEEQSAFPDTTRNTDIPYTPGESLTVTIDGFLLSDNVSMKALTVPDTEFTYSDHNPVSMVFSLLP